MATVKGSNQYKMMVVPYRPLYRWLSIFGLLAAFVLAVVGSYHFGFGIGTEKQAEAISERDSLLVKLADTEAQLDTFRQDAVNLKLGSQVDRKANEGVRKEVIQLKGKITELQEDISFYRGLMSPSGNKRGLTIGSLDVISTGVARRYSYKVVLQQLAVSHKLISGQLSFNIVGRSGVERVVLPLKKMSEQVDSDQIKLRFKYFQNIEGELVLPEGFEPERIELVAKSYGSGSTTIEKNFGWLVQES